MHLFVYFKKRSRLALLIGSALLVSTLFSTKPDISRPVSIVIFFVAVTFFVASLTYVLTGPLKSAYRRFAWSIAIALYVCYLVALSSLRLLELAQFTLATVVLLLFLFVVQKSDPR